MNNNSSMPTFTTIAFENLLDSSSVRLSLKKPPPVPAPNVPELDPKPRNLYISPSLYATPEQASIAAYSPPKSTSPSPYIANHKGRRNTLAASAGIGIETKCETAENDFVEEEGFGDNFLNDSDEFEEFDNDEVLQSISVGSGRRIESRNFVSANGDFLDANDDFSLDGSMCSAFGVRTESGVNTLRSCLHVEIERKKTADETLYLMHSHWERIAKLISDAGFAFPAPPPIADSSMLLEFNDMDRFSQEVAVTRFVAEAIGQRGARAEAEEAFASIVERKDQEILRLRDRLQYYETVNHELSQRKLVEVARIQQQRKKCRRRWMWSLTGLSVVIWALLVAAYLDDGPSDNSTDYGYDLKKCVEL